MSQYKNAYPSDYFEDEDPEDYDEYARPRARQSQNLSNDLQKENLIKIIPKLGFQAGISKSDFDISLDANAQQWFDQIHQYWKQCKFFDTLFSDSREYLKPHVIFQSRNRQCYTA